MNSLEEWFDEERRLRIVVADATDAAATLARNHLCASTSAYYLAKAIVAVAMLSCDLADEDEAVSLQMKCSGPLGGFNVEATSKGTLRGYTEKKIIDEFDGSLNPKDKDIIGRCRIQVTRSRPGIIVSQGIASSLQEYFTSSLQRSIEFRIQAATDEEGDVISARALMVEAMTDSPLKGAKNLIPPSFKSIAVSSRNILAKLGSPKAVLKKTTPLAFGCRCSLERAKEMVETLKRQENDTSSAPVEVVCHMCGRIWTV